MEQTFKTYDGVEVKRGASVWVCNKHGMDVFKEKKDIPMEARAHGLMNESQFLYYFSTQEACQAYIDEVNKPKSIMGEEWDKTIVDGLQITNEKWVQMLGRANRASTPPPRIEYAPTPNGQMATEATGETKPLVSRNSARLDQLIAEANKHVEFEHTPIIVPSDNNYQLNVGGGEPTKLDLHLALTQFSEAYKIPINDILEFIINQKSK